jgi:hypothetical protein
MRYACLIVLLALACASNGASSPSKSSDDWDVDVGSGSDDSDSDAKLPPPTGAPQECYDEQGEPVECLSDADCCEGFYCGIDPEGSTRIKTCIYGGGD